MLHRETTSDELFKILTALMALPELNDFRLVGGTALSLLRGHRESVDIDLFCDGPYGEIPFDFIYELLKFKFPYVDNISVIHQSTLVNNQGLYLFIGQSEELSIKTDILYWDAPFLYEPIVESGIRIASIEDIACMKLDAISRGGRKKDFWDILEILETYKLADLFELYKKKYPWFDIENVYTGFRNFTVAEQMPDPICYKNRNWEEIKVQILKIASAF